MNAVGKWAIEMEYAFSLYTESFIFHKIID
jgi:hypothetical protein